MPGARRDTIQGITKPALQRLARKAGAKRVSGMLYEELRGVLKVYLDNLVQAAVVSMTHDDRKSLHKKDAELALKKAGKAYGGLTSKRCSVKGKRESKKGSSKGPRRFRPGTQALREIKYYQKHSDCLVLPQSVFKRLVKELALDWVDSIRVGAEAALALQVACEVYLVNLLGDAVDVAVSRGSQTITPGDVQVVRKIRKERA